jgi:ElaB/YqjD/DUF883 family membrane-anchored ribosome-binding protein
MRTDEKLKSKLSSLMHRKKAQLKRLEAEVEDLRADLAAEGDEEGIGKVIGDDLDGIRARVAGRLGELQKAGGESVEALRNSAEDALDELRRGLQTARRKIREA